MNRILIFVFDGSQIDLEQWEFYVIPTSVLDREMGDTQSISLALVQQHSPVYTFKQLEQLEVNG